MIMKTYCVEVVETRVVNVFVKAESESEAEDKAGILYSTDEFTEQLNSPGCAIDGKVENAQECEPLPTDKVYS
jgi:hypothetical protein